MITRSANAALLILISSGVVSAALWTRAKAYFVVVTERQVICYRMSRYAWRLTKLLFTAPLAATQVTVGGQTPLGKSVRYRRRYTEQHNVHLYVGNRSAGDLDEVLRKQRR